jgi:hypothetical protein
VVVVPCLVSAVMVYAMEGPQRHCEARTDLDALRFRLGRPYCH